MPTNHIRTARRQRLRKPLVILLVTVSLGSFAVGYWTGDRRLEDRAYAEGQRQLREFLSNADRLGIIDHGRLDELTADSDDAVLNAP